MRFASSSNAMSVSLPAATRPAQRLAAARLQRLGRPRFEIGPRRSVVADLASAVRRLSRGDALDDSLVDVDLGEREEEIERWHDVTNSCEREKPSVCETAFARACRSMMRRTGRGVGPIASAPNFPMIQLLSLAA
jgi:hypothetical protein